MKILCTLLVKLTVVMLFLISCRQISYSPFDAYSEKHHSNQDNISKLASLDATLNYPFKVAVISDTHNDYDELEKIISYINDHQEQYALIIHAGDITTYATKREYEVFKRIIDKSKRPILVAVGNHDLIANGRTLFERFIGPFTQVAGIKDINIAILSNNNWEMSGTPNYQWLENVLSTSTANRQIVVMHIPPLQAERFNATQRQKIIDLASNPAYNVKYIISGHIHSKSNFSDFGSTGARHLDAGHSTQNGYFLSLEFTATDIYEDTVHY